MYRNGVKLDLKRLRQVRTDAAQYRVYDAQENFSAQRRRTGNRGCCVWARILEQAEVILCRK